MDARWREGVGVMGERRREGVGVIGERWREGVGVMGEVEGESGHDGEGVRVRRGEEEGSEGGGEWG